MRNNRLIKQSALALGFIGVTALFAQEKMYIHKSTKETLGINISKVDSVFFLDNEQNINFSLPDSLVEFPISVVDSITFG